MPPRLHVDLPIQSGLQLTLPAGAARHVQVLRLQPGDALILFNGSGGEWALQGNTLTASVLTPAASLIPRD